MVTMTPKEAAQLLVWHCLSRFGGWKSLQKSERKGLTDSAENINDHGKILGEDIVQLVRHTLFLVLKLVMGLRELTQFFHRFAVNDQRATFWIMRRQKFAKKASPGRL
jgi:hypothetical protein